MKNTDLFYRYEDVCEILSVSRNKAYEIIRVLNKELESQGYMTFSGRVSKKYFNEKFYCSEKISSETNKTK